VELLEQSVAGDLDAFDSVFRQFQREAQGGDPAEFSRPRGGLGAPYRRESAE